MTCCKKCYYRNKNSKYTNENCVFFDQSVEILDWVQLCLRRCFEDVASAQQLRPSYKSSECMIMTKGVILAYFTPQCLVGHQLEPAPPILVVLKFSF